MHKTRNSLSDNTRKSMVELLQQRLVDCIDLSSHAKQAHWNVKGANFIALHELFDQIHAEAADNTDLLAERLVALGGQARGTMHATAASSSLPSYPVDVTEQSDHVEALSISLGNFGETVRAAISEAEEAGDAGTADLLTQISSAVDKSLWLVEAHGTN